MSTFLGVYHNSSWNSTYLSGFLGLSAHNLESRDDLHRHKKGDSAGKLIYDSPGQQTPEALTTERGLIRCTSIIFCAERWQTKPSNAKAISKRNNSQA